MQRWEYRIEETDHGPHNGKLNTLGAEGWELVSEVVVGDPPRRPVVRSVFRRPRD